MADTLSRPSGLMIRAVSFPGLPSIDFPAIPKDQDPSGLLETSSLSLGHIDCHGTKLWYDTSGGRIRHLVPLNFCSEVFQALHGRSHGGTGPTIKHIAGCFVWDETGYPEEVQDVLNLTNFQGWTSLQIPSFCPSYRWSPIWITWRRQCWAFPRPHLNVQWPMLET